MDTLMVFGVEMRWEKRGKEGVCGELQKSDAVRQKAEGAFGGVGSGEMRGIEDQEVPP